jgi:hypothetical protein
MSIVLLGSTSGSCTLQEQAIAGTTVLDLPAVSGTILTTGSSGQSIPKAALPTGSVLQVVNGTAAYVTTSSATAVDTGLTATITPTASTSKVLVLINLPGITSTGNQAWNYDLTNGSNTLIQNLINYNVSVSVIAASYSILHSPATTSAITYKVRFYIAGGGILRLGDYSANNSISTITLLEIAA